MTVTCAVWKVCPLSCWMTSSEKKAETTHDYIRQT
jgi:hypothetical protein